MTADHELKAQLARLRAEYIDKLPARLAELAARAQRARGDEDLEEIREEVHKLRGSSGSHGLVELCAEMERAERALENRVDGVAALPSEIRAALTRARHLAAELVRG